jgi:GNAT superfamily N-acetyltransferase
MDGIVVRRAHFADLPHILRHRRAMFHDMGRGTDAGLDAMLVTTESFLRTAMTAGTYQGWLAETADGRVVGGAGIAIVPWPGAPEDPSPRRGWVQNVYTDPEYRSRGIGRLVMDAVVEWCRAEGFQSIALHASTFGRPLYESMGFRPTNEMRLDLRTP